MKKILFFDTETTGFPQKFSPLEKQPYILQIAGMIGEYTDDLSEVITEETFDFLYSSPMSIPKESSNIHGITDDMVEGRPYFHDDKFFGTFLKSMDSVDIICGHNIDFDIQMVFIHIDRLMEKYPEKNPSGFKNRITDKTYCTMKLSVDHCAIPGEYFGRNKWPKLMELHTKLFGEGFDAAHNALADITATRKCFFELVRLKIISL